MLVKFETAMPGDPSLIHDKDSVEEMMASLGRPKQVPTTSLLRKLLLGQSTKLTKLFVTSSDRPLLLYVDPRMFGRDLINGFIDMELPSGIDIFSTFPAAPVLERVHAFVMESAQTSPNQGDLLVPNHMFDNINFFIWTNPSTPEYAMGPPICRPTRCHR